MCIASLINRRYLQVSGSVRVRMGIVGRLGLGELWNFRSRERTIHGMELSLHGTFVPWNFRSRERKFLFQELSLQGTVAPGSPRTFAPTPSDFRSLNSFMDIYARIGLQCCENVHRSFNVCFTKALYRRLNYFSITHSLHRHFTVLLAFCQAYSYYR